MEKQRADEPGRWHARHLLAAPHRLAFFLATLVLLASGAWWALVQLGRSGLAPVLPWALPSPLAHGAVMVFGPMPLFFAGFLFTAGPRWLAVPPLPARAIAAPLLAQAAGWLLWLGGVHLHRGLAIGGLLLAACGMADVARRFWRLVRASRVPDRLHARVVGAALAAGCLCLFSLAGALAAGAGALAQACILAGLWTCVVVVFVTVSHRMLPVFGSAALPMAGSWPDTWLLWLMVAAALAEALAGVLNTLGAAPAAWQLVHGMWQIAAGAAVLWFVVAWGGIQNLRIRLLAMLHLGFAWLGAALVLGGLLQLASLLTGERLLALAALHAVTLGCLGSLMLAMVSRVSSAHSGRAVVADGLLWHLFCVLQLATVLRLAAAVPAWPGQALLLASAALWSGLLLAWGARHMRWYGLAREGAAPAR
jgi:uncharacterized protein involved in response to NO